VGAGGVSAYAMRDKRRAYGGGDTRIVPTETVRERCRSERVMTTTGRRCETRTACVYASESDAYAA
jgi:hypothetical protein